MKHKKTYREIKNIEIIPEYNGYTAYIGYVFQHNNINYLENSEVTNNKLTDMISIDTGVKNLMTIYNPSGTQIIIKGGSLLRINEYYNKRISQAKKNNIRSNHNKKQDNLSKKTKKLLLKRENKLNYVINLVVSTLHKKFSEKKEVVIGYNKNWKQNVNLGRRNNRKFYSIPYQKIIHKLKDKFTNTRITEINEAFTSKCDALALEEVKKHDIYLGKRAKRGLFKSSKEKLINADLNGAINIMRKHCKHIGLKYNKVKGNSICNPSVLKLHL